MELSEEDFHDIHHYLSGKGTPGERADFERRMGADPSLARETEAQRRIRDGLRANEYKQLFQNIHGQLDVQGALPMDGDSDHSDPVVVPLNDSPGREKTTRWRYLVAAASILIAVGIGWYASKQPDKKPVATVPPLTIPDVSEDSVVIVPAEATDDTSKVLRTPLKRTPKAPAEAEPDYFAQYFDADAGLTSPFSKEKLGFSPSAFRQWQTDTAHVQNGIRHLLEQQGSKALEELNLVQNSRFTQVKDAAEWYAALAFLQQNDRAGCRQQLQKIVDNPDSEYQARAVELLRKMK